MTKIVVCNGMDMYDVNHRIYKRYFELCNTPCYFYIRSTNDCIVRCDNDVSHSYDISLHDFGKYVKPDTLYSSDAYVYVYDIPRDDINFVRAVEEISCDDMKIIEIPDDIEWVL